MQAQLDSVNNMGWVPSGHNFSSMCVAMMSAGFVWPTKFKIDSAKEQSFFLQNHSKRSAPTIFRTKLIIAIVNHLHSQTTITITIRVITSFLRRLLGES